MADEVLTVEVYEVDRATLLSAGELAAHDYFGEQSYRLESVSVERVEVEVNRGMRERSTVVDGYVGRFTFEAGAE